MSAQSKGGAAALSRGEVKGELEKLADGWRLAGDAKSLSREIVFKDFARAMAFLNRVADAAEAVGHHPDFCLQGWNRVTLTLSTHSAGGLTPADFDMASKIDAAVRAPE